MPLFRPYAVAGLLAFASTAFLFVGCTRESATLSPNQKTEAAKLYGQGPQPSPRVKYQPDVILMSGGPAIIRSVSQDGLTWTIDGRSKEARELSPGKIMFATSRAVGRIVDIEQRGDDLAISVVPVRLTEVVRDANLHIEKKLHSPLVGHSIPAEAEMYASEPTPEAGRLIRVGSATDGSAYSGKIPLKNGFEVEPFIKSSDKQTADKTSQDKEESIREIGVKIGRRSEGYGIKLSTTVSLTGKDIRVRADLIIVDGKMQDASSFIIEGVEGLDLGIVSGSGEASTVKIRLQDTFIDTGADFMVEGIPMAILFKSKAYMEFAFSSGKSTLSAHGRYALSGPIGFDQGTVNKPTIKLVDSLLQSVEGDTPGPAGVVMAVEFRFLLGIGSKDTAVGGGYGKLVVSTGVSQGSGFGLPLAQCHGVTLKMDAGIGFGLEVNKSLFDVIGIMNPKLQPQIADFKNNMGAGRLEVELGKEFGIVNVSAVEPNIRLCGGGTGA